MKALLALCALCALDCARAQVMPQCGYDQQCVPREPRNRDGWNSSDYLVDGSRMSVAIRDDAIRWSCEGHNPTDSSPSSPHFSDPYGRIYSEPVAHFAAVELIDCDIPLNSSYKDLFKSLSISSATVRNLDISMSASQPRYSHWPSTDHIKYYKNKYQNSNKFWLTATASDLPKNSLESLSLRGIPMTIEQFISIHNIKSVTLIDTGLEEVMDLSEFWSLSRLELREPSLLNAEELTSAPALQELVLHAPDAGLTTMPNLRNATFIEVYIMGSLFGDCTNLKHLALERGELAVLPDRWLVGCNALKSLKVTLLQNLIRLPGDLLADTTQLRHLDLSYNSLENLPKGLIDNTRSLEYIDVSHNRLTSLPGDLPVSLTHVFACGNYRDSLPLKFQGSSYSIIYRDCVHII